MIQNFLNRFKKSFSFGSTLPEYRLNQSANWSTWSTERAISEGYKSSTWVYACVNLIARSTASVPWYVYRRDRSGSWERVEGHPLELLIERPNPFMSRKDFIETMTAHLYLGGNSINSKVKVNGVTVELWSILPDGIKVIPSKTEFISHYEYNKDGVKHKFKTDEIIHNMFIDPSNPYWGMSPLQAGAKVVDTDLEAVSWNKVSLQNRAITDGVFSLNQNLTEQQFKDLRKMVREQHQGAENGRTPWILGSGAQWNQMSLSPAEMDFIASRQFSRTEIASIFQVPPPMIGILDNANYSNIETARKIFWQDTIVPYLEDIKNNLNLSLVPDFGDDIKLDYDVSNVEAIQENYGEKITNARQLWAMGVPFNQINQRLELGLDEIPGGDVGFLPSSVLPADLASSMFDGSGQTSGGNAQTNEEEDDDQDDDPDPPGEKRSRSRPSIKRSKRFESEEEKSFYWKSNERRRLYWYTNLTSRASGRFEEEGNAVIKALNEKGIDDALSEIDSSRDKWVKYYLDAWTNIVDEFGSDQWDRIQPQKSKGVKANAFDPWSKVIRDYIHRTAGQKVDTLLQFTKDKIGQLVQDNREENGTIDTLARAIKGAYQDFSRYRAYRIGRTETVGASNYGQYASAKQTGLKLQRQWISSRDDRVRSSHEDIDGEVVGMDEFFSNGVQYPADYVNGDGAETINCRCTVAYIQD